MAAMMAKAQHARQGYETCGCGRPQCRKKRTDDRRTQRRIEKAAVRREISKEMAA